MREYFKNSGIENKIQEFEASSATVELAAKALGCEPERIAKTLSFKCADENGCVLVVAAGDAKVDNKKFKAEFGCKASMLEFDSVEKLTGHAVGGVCPFAVNGGAKVYLDISLKRFDKIYPACGSANSAVGLSCGELSRYSDNFVKWVDVCKGWE